MVGGFWVIVGLFVNFTYKIIATIFARKLVINKLKKSLNVFVWVNFWVFFWNATKIMLCAPKVDVFQEDSPEMSFGPPSFV